MIQQQTLQNIDKEIVRAEKKLLNYLITKDEIKEETDRTIKIIRSHEGKNLLLESLKDKVKTARQDLAGLKQL